MEILGFFGLLVGFFTVFFALIALAIFAYKDREHTAGKIAAGILIYLV